MPNMIKFIGNDSEGMPLKRKQSQRACERCRKRKRADHDESVTLFMSSLTILGLPGQYAHANAPAIKAIRLIPIYSPSGIVVLAVILKRCLHQLPQDVHEWPTSGENERAMSRTENTTDELRASQPRPKEPGQRQTDTNMSLSAADRPRQLPSPATAGSMTSVPIAGNVTDVDDDEEGHETRFIGELDPEGIFVAHTSPITTAAISTSSPEDVVGIWVPRKLVDAAKALPGPILPVLLPYLEDECSRLLPRQSDYDVLYRTYLEDFHSIIPIINIESYQRRRDKSKLLLKLAVCLCVASNPGAVAHLTRSPKDFTLQVTQLLRSAVDNKLVQDKQIIIQLLVILALSTQLSDDRHASAEFTCRAVAYIHTCGMHLDPSPRGAESLYISRLFCCVFALDRINAAVQGRPVLMHKRDIGRDLDACIEQQDSLFQLLLRIALLLDQVIALYRPLADNTNVNDNTQISDSDFPAFEDLLSSCGNMRAPAALVATVETFYHAVSMLSCRSQSLSKLSKNSASHTRQKLSATSIASIAGNEYRGQLSILPFVPYAMSLALRVLYRDLRLSKSSFTRARARRQLVHVCTLLRELGDIFSASIQMANLAEQTVREMDKAYSNVVSHRRGNMAPVMPGVRHEENQKMTPPPLPSTTKPQDRDQQDSRSAGVSSTEAEVAATFNPISITDDYNMRAFDAVQFDFDLDIFKHFDPDFDIGAIDAALADSIDPSLPLDMVHWDVMSD